MLENCGEDTDDWGLCNAKRSVLLTVEVYLEFLKEYKAKVFPDFLAQMKILYIQQVRAYVKKRQMKEPILSPTKRIRDQRRSVLPDDILDLCFFR